MRWVEGAGHFWENLILMLSGSGYLSELTLSFFRPVARRRDRTACPSEVFMRVRKPCVFARLRLFGWKVRLGMVFFSYCWM
jgi:hypothetical protein